MILEWRQYIHIKVVDDTCKNVNLHEFVFEVLKSSLMVATRTYIYCAFVFLNVYWNCLFKMETYTNIT